MHTRTAYHLIMSRPFPRMAVVGGVAATALLWTTGVDAAAPTTAPQVLIAVTNSESMDGTTSGAIMTGSGSLSGTGYSFLNSSSSPVNFVIPTGFVPPLNAGTSGSAPYTVTCGTLLCDNGPSRLNMTKTAIKQVIASYASSINFGLYDYSTSGTSVYNTWVYQMSPAGGFTFTTTPVTGSVPNPCYQYSGSTGEVNTDCRSIATVVGASTLANNAYMTVSQSSDDAVVNDVLYAPNGYAAVFIDSGGVSPANPYTTYSLNTYNTNLSGFSETYGSVNPSNGIRQTSPTNAGYVPFSTQVLYSQRGFGYNGNQDATTGHPVVAMNTDPTTSTAFTTALAPETNSMSTGEIKSAGGQSAIGGILAGAKSYLAGIPKATCQSQFVVLMTDGLPTIDMGGGNNSNAKTWPPLGTVTANVPAYGPLTAHFNADGSFLSSNSQAVTDAMASIAALKAAGINTYVIGLGAGVNSAANPIAAQLLQAMAIAGGTTSFFPATDPTSLNNAFQVIVQQIYASSSISAPIAPISVSSGSSLEYALSSTTPAAGHVDAFTVDANGNPTGSGAPTWQAENLMSAGTRLTGLYSNLNDTNHTVTLLSALDAAAFALPTTPTTCVPNTATVVNYTANPGYAGACSYLAGRQTGSLLGAFSTQDTAKWVGPPASALLLQKYSSYLTYARTLTARPPMLMFTDADGFLYSLNANTGVMNWGWTSRTLVAKLQNYSTFASSGSTNGNFAVIDAPNGLAWGTYAVGSFQSGAEHYSVKLDANGNPATVVYDQVVTGTAVGDSSAPTGTAPLRQPSIIAYIGNAAYSVYVTTLGTVSTLYETNVATGATTSMALSFQVSSALFLDPSTNQLWLGATTGNIYAATLTTGTAATDLATTNIQLQGQTVNPATGLALGNVQWIGSFSVNGTPYFYAMNAGQLTIFGVASTGWTPLFASTTSAGYTHASGAWAVSASVTTLTANAVVSDMPLVIGGALLVPVYVAGTGCNTGQAYYDLFSVTDGTFPTAALAAAGLNVTSDIHIGSGIAFTPSVTLTPSGYSLQNGPSSCTTISCGNEPGTNKIVSGSMSWRQH